MKDDNLIDYAMPLIDASKAIKKANDALLKQNHDEAMEALLDLAVCARTAYVSVRFQKEQQNALRKQTAPV